MYVSMHLEDVLKGADLSVSCEGAFSVGIEEFEFMTGFFASRSLADLLADWRVLNPSLGRPFISLPLSTKWESPDWLKENLHSVFEEAVKNILPSDYRTKWQETEALMQFPED